MTALPAINNKNTVLTADFAAVDVVAFVVSTVGWPTAGVFSIGTEVIAYTGKTVSSFTGLTRGYDGTTAAAYLTGATISLRIIAKHLNDAAYQNASPTPAAIGGIPAGTTFTSKTSVQEMFSQLLGTAVPVTPVALSTGANLVDSIPVGTQWKVTYDVTLLNDLTGVMESFTLTLIMRGAGQFSYLISNYLNYPDSGGVFDVVASVAYVSTNFELTITAGTPDWTLVLSKTTVPI